jgi:DNA-binding XRE family transcriptional regulator
MINTKFTISALRTNLGLTQEELATKLGITKRQYIFIEKNPLSAKTKYIVKIAHLAKVPLDMIDYGCEDSQ